MSDFNRDALIAQLKPEEGYRGFVYDDKTGLPIKPGTLVEGHPTVGYGLALDVDPLTEEEAAMLLGARADRAVAAVRQQLPWLSALSDARQRAIYDMAYNLGVTGLLKFWTFLSFMRQGNFGAAAIDLEATPWYKQVGTRGVRIVGMIRTG